MENRFDKVRKKIDIGNADDAEAFLSYITPRPQTNSKTTMLTIGYDIGSSSVKAVLFDAERGTALAEAYRPKEEMPILARQAGWAEQDPAMWWEHLKEATQEILRNARTDLERIGAVGISYQMHGLVVVDNGGNVLRPSIIWCDSRATEIGREAFDALGHERCLGSLLNSPGNFTASKLRWVALHEKELFARVHKFMLPGDYIAMRLTDRIVTTVPGLSEEMAWDFSANAPAGFLLREYGIDPSLIPETVPTFGEQGKVTVSAAAELGIPAGIPVTYRAGDQPNNALSLNVLEPGVAAAADAVDEAGQNLAPSRRMDYFRVKLQAEHPGGAVLDDRVGGVLRDGDGFEPRRQSRQPIPVRIPDLQGLRQAGEQRAGEVFDAERAFAVFAFLARLHSSHRDTGPGAEDRSKCPAPGCRA